MKKLYILLTLVLIAGVLTACGQKDSVSSDNTKNGQPKYGGSMTVGIDGDPTSFNPLYTADRNSLIVQQAIYAPLFYTDRAKAEPALAESLKSSNDHLTYTLKLKKNLTWHDGKPLNADDIVFTINSILDEHQATWLRAGFVYNNKPVQVKKVDDLTVSFKLPTVAPAFEAAIENIYPIPKHIFENEKSLQKSEKNKTPIGSGPFKFVEYKPGQYVKMERFDHYFAGKPYLDKMVFQVFKDAHAANLALQNGEIQLKGLQPNDVEKVKSNGNDDVVIYPEYRMMYISFNMNVPELNNVKFRQALSYSLDRKELINAAYGSEEYGDPASSIFTPDVKYQTTKVETYEQDLDKAKQLLKESGVDTSKKFNIIYVNNNKAFEGVGLYLQQQFKKIGVNLELDSGDANRVYSISDDRKSKAYDLYLDGYIMRSEPDAYKQLYKGDAPYNYSNYHNAVVDALWNKASVTPDGAERQKLYEEIQQKIAKDAVAYPISYDKNTLAIDKRYGGIKEAKTAPITMLRDFGKLYLK